MVTSINQFKNESVQATRHVMVLLHGVRIFDLWLIMQGFQQVSRRISAMFLSSDVAIDSFIRAEVVDLPGDGIKTLMPIQMERLTKWSSRSMIFGFAGWTTRLATKTIFFLVKIHCLKESFVSRSKKCAIITLL